MLNGRAAALGPRDEVLAKLFGAAGTGAAGSGSSGGCRRRWRWIAARRRYWRWRHHERARLDPAASPHRARGGIVLVGGIGGWAATSEFAGAVIAQGQLVVDTNVKKVQHPTGGVVAELRVRDGDIVKAGDIVIRLDDTQTRANLAIVVEGTGRIRGPQGARGSRTRRPRASSLSRRAAARARTIRRSTASRRRSASCSRSAARRAKA